MHIGMCENNMRQITCLTFSISHHIVHRTRDDQRPHIKERICKNRSVFLSDEQAIKQFGESAQNEAEKLLSWYIRRILIASTAKGNSNFSRRREITGPFI